MASAPARDRPPAAGGVAILAAAARARAVVAGAVSGVAPVDLHGWRAELRVDAVLLGDLELGETITIGWEELSARRRVRFAEGERALVVLEPLPTQSLWRTRFPARAGAPPVFVIASRGDAFLVAPDGPTLNALEHYLAITPGARDGTAGVRRLAELVHVGHPAVAREALALLEEDPARADRLDAAGAASLLAAARSASRDPALRGPALRLAARHRVPGARETALVLAEPGSPIRVDAHRALAVLPDGLPPGRAEALLADPDPEIRMVGVEAARGAGERARLVTMTREDPAPVVRLAAGRALLVRHGADAIADVGGLLDDPDASVRSGIAERLGDLGAPAVAPLRGALEGGSERAALAAVLALSRAGPGGAAAIAAAAETHPNESVRAFARLALGEAPGHTHE